VEKKKSPAILIGRKLKPRQALCKSTLGKKKKSLDFSQGQGEELLKGMREVPKLTTRDRKRG